MASKSKRLVSSMTFEPAHERNFSTVDDELLTVQDQSMTVRDMIARFTVNQFVPERQAFYEDGEVPDPRTLDLVDLYDLRQRLSEDMVAAKEEINALVEEHRLVENTLAEKRRQEERQSILEALKSKGPDVG